MKPLSLYHNALTRAEKDLLRHPPDPADLTPEITLLRLLILRLTARLQSTDPSHELSTISAIVDAMQPLAALAHTQNLITPNSDTLTHTLTDVLAQLDALQHP